MNRRRVLGGALIACAVIALLVIVGRWERTRHAAAENRGIARVLAAVGPLDSPSLSGFRVFTNFDCLTYRRRSNPLALDVREDELTKIRSDLDAEIEAAIAQAEREPDPRPEDAARHVYAEDHPIPDGTRA